MRLFIGLEPPAAARKAIAHARDQLHARHGGKPTSTANLHLTLAFIGHGDVQTIQQLRHLLADLDHPGFEFTLDRIGDFKQGAIVWLGCGTPSASLDLLAHNLRLRLGDARVGFDPQPFTPHVTLLRKAQPIIEALPTPIHWQADAIVLYESVSTAAGVCYRPLFRHPLK
ncbi:RNA 2',3'-cyclic phosphodiesterase [Jeongeupia wiesaeckerbachi]|uniref:RNA 2',3'-cyclic phosphodiesterase n=1 Tax=Jeongeupia wiesaeckerbachi TaxID=3051218 RepID=UPI003D80748B